MDLTIDERLSAFKKAVEKEYKMMPGESKVEKMCTNLAPLDVILSGGIPIGRFIELYGSPGSGKSTISLMVAAAFQKIKPVLYMDVEATFSKEWAKSNGMDINDDKLVVYSSGSVDSVESMSAEAVLDMTLKAAESEAFSLIVIDSVAAMVDEERLDADIGKGSIGKLARLLSSALPQIRQKSVKSNTTIMLINQVRDSVNIGGYGLKSQKSTSGNALYHYDDLKLYVAKSQYMKKGEEIIGHMIKIKVDKSKVSIPQRTCTIPLIYEFGISPELALFEIACDLNVINRRGSYYKFDDFSFQGRDNFLDEIIKSSTLLDKITKEVYNRYVYQHPSDSQTATLASHLAYDTASEPNMGSESKDDE